MDKISGFPDELLVKILSFLPTKVAVSTSVLSKRWQFLWMWLPKLDYGFTNKSWAWPSGEPPRDFVNKNLPLHKAPVIESLCLASADNDTKPEDVKLWVEIAVSRYVRELDISYSMETTDNSILPSSFFTCKSLVILKLEDATIKDVSSKDSCLPSLKTLHLQNVFYADEESFHELLSMCPVLEDLDVSFDDTGVQCMRNFAVTVPSLQKLSLFIPGNWYLKGYEIDTPSLKYFKLVDLNYIVSHTGHAAPTLFKDMPKLREAYAKVERKVLKSFIGSVTSVKHLAICSCSEDVYGDGFVFNELEHLKLCVCSWHILPQLLKDSPNLQVLDISVLEDHIDDGPDDIGCWNQPSDVPECILSSLQIFKWSRYFGRPRDRDIAVYILKNARHLKKATFLADTKKHNVSNIEMIKELALSPRASTICELVFVDDKTNDGSDDSSTY